MLDDRIELNRRATFGFRLAGASYYQEVLAALVGRGELDATLRHEVDNSHDPNAILVTIAGQAVGHFPAGDAARFVEWMKERGYEGLSFKGPAMVEDVRWFDEDEGETVEMMMVGLAILTGPPSVVGDLDRATKKVINLLDRQAGTRCVKHMDREKVDPSKRSLEGLVLDGYAISSACGQCGGDGYALTEAGWEAKYGSALNRTEVVSGGDRSQHDRRTAAAEGAARQGAGLTEEGPTRLPKYVRIWEWGRRTCTEA